MGDEGINLNDPETWPQAMTSQEVAQVLRTTPRTVLTMIHTGKLRGQLVGKSWRVGKSTLLKYLEEQEA